MQSQLKILDCSLRDGGYRNNWHFSRARVQSMFDLLGSVGVKYLEFGFLFPERTPAFGPFSRVNDEMLRAFDLPGEMSVGMMVESKAINSFDSAEEFADFVLVKSNSFDFIRIATTIDEIETLPSVVSRIHDSGKEVFVNLMRASQITADDIERLLDTLGSEVRAYYLADSFGSLLPEETHQLINVITSREAEAGFHGHNNRGMALANSLAAIAAGATFIDGTLAGHGRGSGNTKTEELIAELDPYIELTRKNLKELGDHLETFEYSPGQAQDENSFVFHFGAKLGFHPNLVMELMTPSSGLRLGEALEALWEMSLQRNFDSEVAPKHPERMALVSGDGESALDEISLAGETCVLVGAGMNLEEDLQDLEIAVDESAYRLVSINKLQVDEPKSNHLIIALHPFRRKSVLEACKKPDVRAIVAFDISHSYLAPSRNLCLPTQVSPDGRFEFSDSRCSIPKSTGFAYSLAVLRKLGAARIVLAGFGQGLSDELKTELEETVSSYQLDEANPPVYQLGTGLSGIETADLW